ncbi:SDR family NAD(P)-dependent oxidoreductase [Algoriphagus zhangzhouensis]|uniref:Benzil reductase ((S)-benzoin forming) n=1 Tax=Algoriphagus zhangzhouensis TaxID=1073327 RepID=A0A1M7ZK69_9BACT|nr:SDR family NAD(P)-dependent oxidoreductase [Algoriphagus zhangzhouensis]TDY43102.1 benzil reductase ((S)-benzoin forming) [Algoriphagus zhangzhouensis]SHO65209.1 benzil reductase ((S)-benzoin forming) [Algoriphagus zhangzhouensis]
MSKTLLILTGHSKGLGRAILDQFLKKEGVEVLAISRTKLNIEASNLTQLPIDLSELEVLDKELESIFPIANYETIILINNAGWIGEIKPIGKLHPSEMRTQVNLNLLAPMFLTNSFVKSYKFTSSKNIVINISSGASSRPVSGWGGYCSTKAALAMFTLVAAKENKSDNFKFFSLAPGIVDTEMQADIRKSSDVDFPELEKFQDFKSNGDLSDPKEVAEKIDYLISNVEKFNEVIQDVRKF